MLKSPSPEVGSASSGFGTVLVGNDALTVDRFGVKVTEVVDKLGKPAEFGQNSSG